MSDDEQLPPLPEEAIRPARNIFKSSRPKEYRVASKGKRIIACLLDGFFAAVFTGLVGFLLGKTMFAGIPLGEFYVTGIEVLVISPLYWIGGAHYFGATPGKKILGLKIINLDGTTEVPVRSLVLRELLFKFVSALPLMLGYLWGLFREDGKTWHDHLAKTKVVEDR